MRAEVSRIVADESSQTVRVALGPRSPGLDADGRRHFETTHLQRDLKRASLHGGSLALAGQAGRFLLRLASTIILARLLTPNEFGLVAMVTAVTAFVGTFKDLGLSMATVQRAEVNQAQISTLFWVNVLLGIALTLITIALAPAAAWFYGEPRLTAIALALSVSFVFAGLTVQHQALLRRQMRYGTLAVADLVSLFVGIVTAVVMAAFGCSYWSLVGMTVTAAAVNAIAVWLLSGWRPSRMSTARGVGGMLRFGRNITAGNVCTYVRRNLDKVLLGWCWGAGSLGIYAKAYQLVLAPMTQLVQPISPVAISALSRLQDHPARYRRFYLKTVRLIGYATMPPAILLLIFHGEIVDVLLGPQWSAAAEVFGVLVFVALFYPAFSTIGWLLVSLDQTDRIARWSLFEAICQSLGLLVGLQFGPLGVATAFAVTFYLLRGPHLVYCLKPTPVGPKDLLAALARPLALSLAMGLSVVLLMHYVGFEHFHTRIPAALCAVIVVGALSLAASRGIRGDFSEAAGLLKTIRNG